MDIPGKHLARYGGTLNTITQLSKQNTPSKILRILWIFFSSIFIIWVLIYELDWAEVTAALEKANYYWVVLGILITTMAIFFRTWRWQVLLYRFQTKIFGLMYALLIGQAVNLVLPLRSGDLMRVISFREIYGSSGAEALGTVAIEKVWDVIALVLCSLSLLFIIPLTDTFLRTVWSTIFFLTLAIVILFIALRWQKPIVNYLVKITGKLPERLRVIVLPRVVQFIRGMDVIRHSQASSRALLYTLGVWGTGILANWAVMRAFGEHSFSAAVLLMATLMSGNSIVPIPGRLGVFEAVVIGSLSLYAVPRDTALAIGLVLHMVAMGTPMVVAIILAVINAVRRELVTFFH